ncbi:3-oxoacyl-[acyl-carrier-protein] reductase [Coxiella burnetii str. Namibia]|nr:3-oxoacyl-[acyl-carrier-protein] reductase [Coxiella burnetii str. Namibia]
MRLKNKSSIVTGASRGIGKAIAFAFASEGANVIVIYRNSKKKAIEVSELIKSQYKVKSAAIKADVSLLKDIAELISSAEKFFGSIDILVNNAGVGSRAAFTDVTEEQFNQAINVNLKGPFFLTQAVAKHMIAHSKTGSIINISSISSFKAELNISAYECAKAGESILTKSAALALAPHHIRVNTISPGLTATDMTQSINDPLARPLSERAQPIPLGRVGQPKDHAGAAIFLASDESSWITGSNIIVDGGESIK